MMNKDPAVFAKNITVSFDKTPALWEVGFSIPSGKMVGILGPNGAGKSTLLKALLGIVKPISGTTLFAGLSYKKMQKKIAYVPQRESVDWDFPIRVIDVALMGRYNRLGVLKWPKREDKRKAEQMLDLLGILHLAHRQISQLSGGQQQRLFLARALLQDADIYLLDEPFAGVDITTEKCIVDLLSKLKEEGKTILVVHHNLNTVEKYFDWILMLNRRLVVSGERSKVFTKQHLNLTYGNAGALLEEVAKLSQQKATV